MSTTFGIPIKKVDIDLNQYDEVMNYYFRHEDDELFTNVWYRSMGKCRWLNPLGELLPDDTKVYALDNSQQGVYTIGDIKEKMKQQETL
jgi:hypothetical protein